MGWGNENGTGPGSPSAGGGLGSYADSYGDIGNDEDSYTLYDFFGMKKPNKKSSLLGQAGLPKALTGDEAVINWDKNGLVLNHMGFPNLNSPLLGQHPTLVEGGPNITSPGAGNQEDIFNPGNSFNGPASTVQFAKLSGNEPYPITQNPVNPNQTGPMVQVWPWEWTGNKWVLKPGFNPDYYGSPPTYNPENPPAKPAINPANPFNGLMAEYYKSLLS